MAEEFSFKKAAPVDEYVRVGIAGPSTSGKTVSAIRMALGLVAGTGKRVALIDTENKRSLKYAKQFDFDHLDLAPPFSSLRYLEAIKAAEAAGYGAIIVDSMSHEHEGPGGILEQHENFLQEKAGNDWEKRKALKFTAWIQPKANRNKLIMQGIQRANAHLILNFRAKEKLEMAKVDGKTQVLPLGWAPIAGEEFPYEMLSLMILPPRSNGKPDWSQQLCTINTLDQDLINMLKSIEQISEQTGADLFRLTRAGATAPPPQQDDRPAHVKTAAAIVRKIQGATDQGDLYDIMSNQCADDLAIVEMASAETHQWVMQKHDEKLKSFADMPA